MNTVDLLRRLDNLLRLGTIAEVDTSTARVRVQSGEILTDWLPWVVFRAGTTRSWSAPTVGEQCIILAVGGEMTSAVVLLSIYASNAPSNHGDLHLVKFPDGAEISYNHASGHLCAKNCQTAEIHAKQSIIANTPSLTCTGNVQIHGTLTVQKQISGNGGLAVQGGSGASFSGNVEQTGGSITTTGDVKAGAISLKGHKHGGIEPGGAISGTPTA